ncbi:MAG: S8 family serine peptidase [Candidatus Korarchaeota archaeon]|nr:S8 family serine peptidase [Candidatus Korarchaeota archaeon]NIU85044.1 S8 family serine peptidase [Candidatus Thorarchaeota archaeon]NIW15069.1 S8 family serine peptidase [Candidatus Thorarchaeota archaeon]NIW53079.1 S8 family serine peptidase [Candidatus Korarchaeota archaeon]
MDPYYWGGDAKDEDVLEWINIEELSNDYQIDLSDVGIGILDSGLDPYVWRYMLDQTPSWGGHIKFVDVSRKWRWWPPGYYYEYKIEDSPYGDTMASDDYGHGTTTTYTMWNVLKSVVSNSPHNIYVFDINYDDGTRAMHLRKEIGALKWIFNHNGGSETSDDIEIVSMSYGGYSSNSEEETWIEKVSTQTVCTFFAASGNDDLNEVAYPAKYDETIAIGAHVDDYDGYTTDGLHISDFDIGHRVTKTISDIYGHYPIWGSNYGDNLDFVAPGFDVEVLLPTASYSGSPPDRDGDPHYEPAVIDGTSYACPIAAAIGAIAAHARCPADDTGPATFLLYSFLEDSAELIEEYVQTVLIHKVPHPTIRGDHLHEHCSTLGWGGLDAYDAYLRAKGVDY